VADWRAEVYDDLDARVLLPGRELAEVGEWGAVMGLEEAALSRELGRRWLLWRDEVIAGGITEPAAARAALAERQRARERSPHPRHGGRSPAEVVRREREARR
jgi:hypothetical protein